MTTINWQTITESEAFDIYFKLRAKFDWCGTPTSMGDVEINWADKNNDSEPLEITSAMREAVRETYEWRRAIDERTAELANSMVPSIEVLDNGDFILHTESSHDVLHEQKGAGGWYIEPMIDGALYYGPFKDEIDASMCMDENDLHDDYYKIVWREEA